MTGRPRPGPSTRPVDPTGPPAEPDAPLPGSLVAVGVLGVAVVAAVGAFVSVLLTPFRIGTVLVPVAVALALAVNLVLPQLAFTLSRSRAAAAVPVVVFFVVAWIPTLAPSGDVLLPGGGAWQTAISFGVLLLGILAGVVTAVRAR